jgi:hypothetical protein
MTTLGIKKKKRTNKSKKKQRFASCSLDNEQRTISLSRSLGLQEVLHSAVAGVDFAKETLLVYIYIFFRNLITIVEFYYYLFFHNSITIYFFTILLLFIFHNFITIYSSEIVLLLFIYFFFQKS